LILIAFVRIEVSLPNYSKMKFAHEFREALEREGFPARWVASAVPYGQLKKCLKKVRHTLSSFMYSIYCIPLGMVFHTLGKPRDV
jgi:hypothetical protein